MLELPGNAASFARWFRDLQSFAREIRRKIDHRQSTLEKLKLYIEHAEHLATFFKKLDLESLTPSPDSLKVLVAEFENLERAADEFLVQRPIGVDDGKT